MPQRLVMDRVSRCYPGQSSDQAALRDVDLAVEGGQFVTLIGPSGCGKSTLLRLMAGLDQPDQGTVTLFGRSPDAVRRAKAIGFVAQRPALMPWLSALDNVKVLQRVNRPRHAAAQPDAAQILAAVGLGDVLHDKPHQLSGGMQQRVAIARAFALTPRLLLMDEPFAALDEFTREALQVQLLDLWERWRTTVVFVTHSIREAVLLGDTVVMMAARPGRILARRVIDLPRPRGAELIGSAVLRAYEDELRRSWTQPA